MRIGSSNVTMTTVKRSLVKNTKKNDLMTLKKARKNVRAIWTGWQACHVGGSIVSRERHSIMMHPMASGHGDRRSDRRELLRGRHISPHPKKSAPSSDRTRTRATDAHSLSVWETVQIGNVDGGRL